MVILGIELFQICLLASCSHLIGYRASTSTAAERQARPIHGHSKPTDNPVKATLSHHFCKQFQEEHLVEAEVH